MSVSEPGKIITPWAESGLKNTIPPAANPATGRAGFDQGFSAINMTAKEAGGIPPFGQDFNGIFYEVTNILRYMQAGGQPTFDAAMATAIGGYPKGAMVLGDDGVAIYTNRVDGNSSNPNSGGSGWAREDLMLREALRRSYAEAGYSLIGTFSNTGLVVDSTTDVVLWEPTGVAYAYSGTLPHTIAAGETPVGDPLWVAKADKSLRSDLASSQVSEGDALISVQQPVSGAAVITQHDMNVLNVDLSQFTGGLPSSADVSLALNSVLAWLSLLGGGVLNVTKPGVYKMLSNVSIPANVTIRSVRGARFKRMYAGGVMFSLLENADDVSIIGGIFDSNGQEYPADAANIFAAYNVKRLSFLSARFLDVVDFHAIDIARTEDVLVRDCKFLGFKDNGSRNFSEAIQLDPGFISSGGTYYPNKRVTVEDCYFGPNPDNTVVGFTSWGAGVGNHADAVGNQSEDITVRGSTFVGCLFGGVRVFNWNGYLIEGNSFKASTARGVHITPVPDSVAPQGTKHGRVIGNTFTGVRTPILVAAATWPFTDITNAFHQHITISNNTAVLSENLSVAFDLSWIDGLTLTANTVRGGLGFASFNFVRNATIGSNVGVDFTSTALWFKEITATTFIGTGLSGGITATGNVIRNAGNHGIHVNCALNGANIMSNMLIGTATADSTSNGIRADSGAKNIFIENNNHLDGGAAIKPQIGISVTATCETVHVINNKVFGTAAPQNNQGINGSSLVMAGGIGAPSTAGVGAPPGSMYLRSDGGALTSLYIKETGTNSIGWVAK